MSRANDPSEAGLEYRVCLEKELRLMEEEGLWSHVDTKEMHNYMMDCNSEQYINGTMHLYRKSLH